MGTVKKGIGLKSILSRVEFYGGEVKINTKSGTGFEVHIKLPFEQYRHDKKKLELLSLMIIC